MTAKTWLDNLRDASFRGVAFHVDGGEKTFGPRTITHEFPLREDPTHENAGNLPKSYSVEAILIGDDLLAQMEQLDTALNQRTPGRLIHPWYGELDVVVVAEVRVRVSTSEGRVARYSIQFQLAGGEPSPLVTADTADAVDKAADQAHDAAVKDFADMFNIGGAQDFAITDAIGFIEKLTGQSLDVFRSFNLGSLISSGKLAADSKQLLDLAPGDLSSPAELAWRVIRFIKPVTGRTTPPFTVSTALLQLASPAGLGANEPVPFVASNTPAWHRVDVNNRSIVTLMRMSAAVEAIRVGSVAGWESSNQAMAWRDEAADSLDAIADRAGEDHWDETWRAATDLRAAMIRDVNVRAAPLPHLATLKPALTLPTAAIAYRIDGDDLDGLFYRADDLRRRNRIRHPGFVPGGRPLEVLVND